MLKEPEEIREWVSNNARTLLTYEELSHITMCLHHLVLWYYENRPVEDFLQAVLKDNLTEACGLADDINLRFIFLYPMFLYNNLPGDWREKAK